MKGVGGPTDIFAVTTNDSQCITTLELPEEAEDKEEWAWEPPDLRMGFAWYCHTSILGCRLGPERSSRACHQAHAMCQSRDEADTNIRTTL
jgi:hypothetical protein